MLRGLTGRDAGRVTFRARRERREVSVLRRNMQIAVAVAAVLVAALFVVGATQAPGTASGTVTDGLTAPDARVGCAAMDCHGDVETACHGSEECPGPGSKDCEDCDRHDGDREENCHGDDGEAARGCHRGARGGCHG